MGGRELLDRIHARIRAALDLPAADDRLLRQYHLDVVGRGL
jgi:hypothetical protein